METIKPILFFKGPATHRDHENLQQLVQLEISCPYPGHKNGDYGTVRIEDGMCHTLFSFFFSLYLEIFFFGFQ